MPNWVMNHIVIVGSPEDVMLIKEQVKSEDSGFDFHKIIPVPDSIKTISSFSSNIENLARKVVGNNAFKLPETISKEDRKNISLMVYNYHEHGSYNWYDWNINNWGTKWNSSEPISSVDNEFWFQTAWSMPEPVLKKLSEQYPNCTIMHEWADEDIGSNCGNGSYSAGDAELYWCTGREAVEFANNLWGWDGSCDEDSDFYDTEIPENIYESRGEYCPLDTEDV